MYFAIAFNYYLIYCNRLNFQFAFTEKKKYGLRQFYQQANKSYVINLY